MRTWAVAYEKPHATFTDEVLLHELHIYIYIYTRHVFKLFSSPQDIASHQPKELVARIERNEWSGKLHLGGFEARIVLAKVFCCVFSPWSGSQAIFVACLRRGRFAISCFFVCAALFLFFLIFSSKKQVPMVTPQDWLKGTRWDGMPYHVTLGPTQGCMLLT